MPAFLLSESLLTVQPITQQLSGIMHLVSTLKLPYISVYMPTEQLKQSYCQTDVVTRMRAKWVYYAYCHNWLEMGRYHFSITIRYRYNIWKISRYRYRYFVKNI